MKSKSTLLRCVAISFIILAGINIQAQGRMQQAPDRAEVLKKELSLNDKQFEQVKNIFAKSREEMMKNREEGMGDPETMMKKFKENNEKTNKKIESLLNADQKKKFVNIKEDWKKQNEERMKRMHERFNQQN